jgi:hypothetical protein
MRVLLLGVIIIVVGGSALFALRENLHSGAELPVGLATPEVRGDLVIQATDAARQAGWPCDVSQLPDQGWSCIVVQVVIENQGTVIRSYDAHHFRLVDQTRYQYPRHLPGYYFPDVGSAPLGQGTLAPGARVQGMLWFAAPRSRGAFTLVYQPPGAGAEPIRVRLPDPLRQGR